MLNVKIKKKFLTAGIVGDNILSEPATVRYLQRQQWLLSRNGTLQSNALPTELYKVGCGIVTHSK
jgi:hypothetical protein